MVSRFEKFNVPARTALSLAQEEAQRFNHNYIGTEHILLALTRIPEAQSVGVRVLTSLGVNLHGVRSALEFIIGRGEKPVQHEIGLTPRVKKVVDLAVAEAHHMNHSYIGTGHLLIALLQEGEGVAAGVLESMGVTLEKARGEVARIFAKTSTLQKEVCQEERSDPFDVSFQEVGNLRQRLHRLDSRIKATETSTLQEDVQSIDSLKVQRARLVAQIKATLVAMSEIDF